jgi:hypothetical protein
VNHVWSFLADNSPLLAGGNDRGNDRRVYMDIPPTRDTPERSPGGSINHAITDRCALPALRNTEGGRSTRLSFATCVFTAWPPAMVR